MGNLDLSTFHSIIIIHFLAVLFPRELCVLVITYFHRAYLIIIQISNNDLLSYTKYVQFKKIR